MTALAHEAPETEMPQQDLDTARFLAWQAAVDNLPEGFRAEIIEGPIEVSPTGRYSHSKVVNDLRDELVVFLAASGHVAQQDMNVAHSGGILTPDLLVAPKNALPHVTEDGVALRASGVGLVVEVVSRGHDSITRDRVRKRRAYAQAGIPLYILIDDYDDGGTVTVLSEPDPQSGVYGGETRVTYGEAATVPSGPARGFVIGEAITGPAREAAP